jgi:hypothetical protein
MSARQQLLAEACSQFIVEYAGDFVTQSLATGVVTNAAAPDGVVDFVVRTLPAPVGQVRRTRWYGLPRDVDEDGIIAGNAASSIPPANSPIWTSDDVIPLRDICGARQLFERYVPVGAANYANEVDEVDNPLPLLRGSGFVTTEDTSYVCIWGAEDFSTAVPYTTGPSTGYRIPTMLRIIADLTDTNGKLQSPVRQEMIFPVPVAK